jgi:L-ribulose-5-phosphate 3-epimerase
MRVATSTNIISSHRQRKRVPMLEFISFLSHHKFNVLDLNFCEMMNPTSVLLTDKWVEYVETLKDLRQKHRLTYNQAHAPYTYDLFALNDDEFANLDFQIKRSIEMAALLEIPYIVLHAATDYDNDSLESNVKWLTPYVELATTMGTGLALENLAYDKKGIKEYCAYMEEIVVLIEKINTPNVVACYDFGHANLMGTNHRENILTLGKHLKCLHVADNKGLKDEHLMPFHGTVPWEECMKALSDIDYKGDFTYEIMFFSENLPKEVHASFLEHAYDVASFLVSLFNSFGGR